MNRKILVVEDDPKVADLIRVSLERNGYHVAVARDGSEALQMARARRPDLIVLDLMLPKLDGLEVCRTLRGEWSEPVPVVMLTARATEEDKLLGLDMGADDYLTKPFSPRELVARVRAVLRRAGENEGPDRITLDDLIVDFARHEVRRAGMPVRLTPKEFRLLATLVREPERAFSRLELLDRVFGSDYDGLERTVDVHVMNLRKKIEPDPARPTYVQTVYGVGYRFGKAADDS